MDILSQLVMGTPLWMWGTFAAIVLALLVVDLGVLHKKQKAIGVRESLLMSAFYIAIGLAFGGWVWHEMGAVSAKEYVTGFLVEKTLAMDNIFLISLIFTYFTIPAAYQHRVLFWGILGVIVLRGIVIAAGATLVAEYAWVLYIFAAFLVATGIKMLVMKEKPIDLKNNAVLKFLRRHLRIEDELHGNSFFVRLKDANTGKYAVYMTPLFLALLMIEIVDLIFALDSVPAIFAITTNPYIVYTSNIFAILGLRALYFALSAIIHRFQYMKQALALVLIFIGSKVFVADMLGLEKFPAGISLGVTVALLVGGVVYSLYKTRADTKLA
ncbi:MAG: TerC family protein [Alphaproteobacteria bacterium]|nr:TerC family protein [Alphaproteobacteria bacterium]